MGKLEDENLPEVVTNQSYAGAQTTTTTTSTTVFDATPEVVSPEDAATQIYFTDRDKYPAHFDNAPKLTYDPNDHPYHGHSWPSAEPVPPLSPNHAMPWENLPPNDGAGRGDLDRDVNEQGKRICGLQRRMFIIIVVVLVIIIAAAVGGGVGATRARSGPDSGSAAVSEGTANSIDPTSTAPTSTGPQSSATSSTTTSSLPTQTIEFLNNQTGVSGLAFQGFEEQFYLGENTSIIRAKGYHDLPFSCLSYVWLPNGTDCCVTFCANKTTAVGWRCDPRYREKTESGTGFPRIYIWCDRAESSENKNKCS